MTLDYSAPSPELEVELDEVRSDAAALARALEELNAPLPVDFPETAVLEVLEGLRALPDGTARGCLRPLVEAQSQLAKIRSQHIIHEDTAEPTLSEVLPPLFRGEPIDQRLRNLMSSVSTALQTAHRLAAEEPEPESGEESVKVTDETSRVSLVRASKDLETEINQERQELDSVRNPDSQKADSLRRRLTDVFILNSLGRSELRMTRVVSARIQRIANALREYPALLKQAANLIVASADIADYAYGKWNKLKERIFKAGTETIREIADDMSAFSRRIETKRRVDAPSDSAERPSDFNIAAVATMIHQGKAPPSEWRPFIKNLDAHLGNRKLGDLKPLKGLTRLTRLTKVKVRVDDISILSELNALTNVDLTGTDVANFAPLSALPLLRRLSLGYTSISDLTPLSGLSLLRQLNLESTEVSDLTPLSNLSLLLSLDLDNAHVSDLKPLMNLSSLELLRLRNTRVGDLTPLSSLSALESLYLNNTQVSDLTPLSSLSALESLNLNNTHVSDLTPLSSLSALESLNLDNTRVGDLTPLSSLSALEWLYLNNTQISDLTPLSNLSALQWLYLNNTQVSDLTPLSRLLSLRTLHLENTQVSDLTPLSSLLSLNWLDLRGTQVSDLTPLLNLPRLRFLRIENARVRKVPQRFITDDVIF